VAEFHHENEFVVNGWSRWIMSTHHSDHTHTSVKLKNVFVIQPPTVNKMTLKIQKNYVVLLN
jgi:hypothetical protein